MALLAVICIVCKLLLFDNKEEPKETVTPSAEVKDEEDIPITEEEEEQVSVIDTNREVVFDNRVTINRDGESYEKEEDVMNGTTDLTRDHVDPYKYSNGFLLESSENINIGPAGFDVGECYSNFSYAKMYIKEENAIKTTVQKLRKEILTDRWRMNYYLQNDPLPIDEKANVTIDSGLKDYERYFEGNPAFDPTRTSSCQLMRDCVIDTAYGPALYVVVYYMDTQKYYAHALISCERDRILNIEIEDDTDEYLQSFILELTNDVISLVE